MKQSDSQKARKDDAKLCVCSTTCSFNFACRVINWFRLDLQGPSAVAGPSSSDRRCSVAAGRLEDKIRAEQEAG